jgi:hypothetical protein
MRSSKALFAVVLFPLLVGCGSSLAQPFDQIKAANSNTTAYRLQNYEQPQQPQNPQGALGGLLPPQIQQWASAAAQMLPPNLLQGLNLPGLGPAQPGAQPQPDAPRFHDFRILGYVPVADAKNKDALFDLFGHASNFQAPTEGCMYAEFGFRLAEAPNPQGQPADVLVSLSCNQVRPFGFVWPYGNNTAFTPDASKKLVDLVKKSFGG